MERWAGRKLRCWMKCCMKRRHEASRAIAFRWLTFRPGRLLRHLQVKDPEYRCYEPLRYHCCIILWFVQGRALWSIKIRKFTVQRCHVTRAPRASPRTMDLRGHGIASHSLFNHMFAAVSPSSVLGVWPRRPTLCHVKFHKENICVYIHTRVGVRCKSHLRDP